MTPRPRAATSWLAAALLIATASAARGDDGEGMVLPDPVALTIDYGTVAAAYELERGGDVDGALKLLEEAAVASPTDAMLVSAHGTVLLTRGDRDGARADFERAIGINSADPSGYSGLCVLAVLDGAPMAVEDRCEAARNRNIVDPVYHKIMVAAVMLDSELDTVSVSTLDTLVVANPYVPALRLLSLEASLRSNNTVVARNELQMLRQMYGHEGDPPPRIIDRIAAYKLADFVGADIPCYLDHARIQLDRAEDLPPAAAALEHVARCRPGEPGVTAELVAHHNSEGLAAWKRGEHAAALDHFRAALELAPEDPTLLANLANVAFESGDLVAAEGALKRLLELTPDDPEIRRNYGIVLHAMGREDEARPYLEEAGIDPGAGKN